MIRIKAVKPRANHMLYLTFSDGSKGFFDVKPYITGGGVFKKIATPAIFKSVKISHGTVEWLNEIDLCPDCVYQETMRRTVRKVSRQIKKNPRKKSS